MRRSGGPLSAKVQLLCTSDLHGRVLDFDYFADKRTKRGSLARCASLIAAMRAQHPNAMLFDNGDFLQGTPLVEMESPEGRPNPLLEAMNSLEYDAIGLGNHEFDFGVEALKRTISGLKAPVLCSNIHVSELRLDASAILETSVVCLDGSFETIRVGVFSVAPPQVLNWNASHLGNQAVARPMAEVAHSASHQLRKAGADIVVALVHSGLYDSEPLNPPENDAAAIAALSDVDAVFCGHVHRVFPHRDHPVGPRGQEFGIDAAHGKIAGTPVAMPGVGGSHLAAISLNIEKESTGWRVQESTSKAVPTNASEELSTIRAPVDLPHQLARQHLARPFTRSKSELHSYFALLPQDQSARLIAKAQQSYVRQELQCTDLAELPVLSAAAPYRCGGIKGLDAYTHIRTGPVTLRNLSELQPFDDNIEGMVLNGRELRDWLAHASRAYTVLDVDRTDQLLRLTDVPSYQADVIAGVSYAIDLTQPYSATARIHSLMHEGKPVTDEQTFVLALNSYRLGGGGRFPAASIARRVPLNARSIRQLIADYMSSESGHNNCSDDWRFAAPQGTKVIFDTHPDAANYLDEIESFEPENLGLTDAGYLRLRLSL